jgi:hypothetical protein
MGGLLSREPRPTAGSFIRIRLQIHFLNRLRYAMLGFRCHRGSCSWFGSLTAHGARWPPSPVALGGGLHHTPAPPLNLNHTQSYLRCWTHFLRGCPRAWGGNKFLNRLLGGCRHLRQPVGAATTQRRISRRRWGAHLVWGVCRGGASSYARCGWPCCCWQVRHLSPTRGAAVRPHTPRRSPVEPACSQLRRWEQRTVR